VFAVARWDGQHVGAFALFGRLMDLVAEFVFGPGRLAAGIEFREQELQGVLLGQVEALHKTARQAVGGVMTALAADGRLASLGVGAGSGERVGVAGRGGREGRGGRGGDGF
jgi:hypothetical protein